ncbi:variable surface lipoprotein, partial [Cystoisospora suis]
DYLYPCRALDPRLYELYGILYYRRLGQTKLEPEGPPPPPPPAYVPLAEGIGGPWIRPSPYTIFRTPGIDDSTIERGMKETKKAIEEAEAKAKGEAAAKKAGDGETAKGPKAVSKVGGGVGGLKPSALKGTASASDSAAAKPAAKKEAPSAPTAEGPPKREPTDPKVELKGMFLFVRKLQDFKRPPSSKVESLRIVV